MEVVIPYNIVEKICQRGRINSMATFFSLKTMYEGGSIHNFYSRLKEIASYVGVTKKTLKVHVNQLIEDGLVHMEGHLLILANKKKVCEFFGVTDQSYYFKHVLTTSHKAKYIKVLIRKLVIAENQAKQKYILNEKDNVKTGKSYPRYRKLRRSRPSPMSMVSENRVQLSQRRYANLLGCNWASSGSYHINKLKMLDELISRPNEPVFITKGDSKMLMVLREQYPMFSFFRNSKGNIYQRRTNTIVLK